MEYEQARDRTPRCRNCGTTESHLGIVGRTRDILYYSCRPCMRRKNQRYRSTPKGRLVQSKAANKYHNEEANRQKVRARRILGGEVRKGSLVKPTECGKCKVKRKVQAHHSDYTKPLDVDWLCSGCHADLHREIRELSMRVKI